MPEIDNCSELSVRLQEFADRIPSVKDYCTDEPKTEQYLIEPFFQVLGYDYHNPQHVVKRYTADVPGRKGEKVDYALIRDEQPAVLVEAKPFNNRLGQSEIEQLQRYFPHTSAKVAVLTDGIRWHWHKGMSEPGQSHQMDSSPFLTYDASEPSGIATEWLAQLTKDGFDYIELFRISRRIEICNAIRNWIYQAFVDPTETSIGQLLKVAGIKAVSDEISLAEDAIHMAWAQVLADRSGPGGKRCRKKRKAVGPAKLRIDAETYVDDSLNIGNGKRLVNTNKERAWRVDGGEWEVAKNAAQLTTAVLDFLLGLDARRNDEASLASGLDSIVHCESHPEPSTHYGKLPSFADLYFNKNLNHKGKVDLLKSVSGQLNLDQSGGNRSVADRVIEVWLVPGPSKASQLDSLD